MFGSPSAHNAYPFYTGNFVWGQQRLFGTLAPSAQEAKLRGELKDDAATRCPRAAESGHTGMQHALGPLPCRFGVSLKRLPWPVGTVPRVVPFTIGGNWVFSVLLGFIR